MNGSARCRSPASRMNACWSSPATRPTSNIRSPRFMRSRSIAATSMPSPNRKFAGVASPCSQTCWSCHICGRSRQRSRKDGELIEVALPDAAGFPEPVRDGAEIAAVRIEIDQGPVGRPVVLGGQEVGERLQPPEQVRVVPVAGRARDRVNSFLAGIIFDSEHAVDVAAEAQRADHVVR